MEGITNPVDNEVKRPIVRLIGAIMRHFVFMTAALLTYMVLMALTDVYCQFFVHSPYSKASSVIRLIVSFLLIVCVASIGYRFVFRKGMFSGIIYTISLTFTLNLYVMYLTQWLL